MNSKQKKVLKDAQSVTNPTNEYTSAMLEYYSYCDTGNCQDEFAQYAFEINKNEYKKEILESLILGGASTTEIEITFGIDSRTIECYKEIFFDLTKVRSRLDILEYIEKYPTPFGKELKHRAFSLGASFIFYSYGKLIPDTNEQKQLLKRLFMTSAFKSLEMQNNSMNSKTSKAAMDYAKVMLAAYNAMGKILDDDTSGKEMGLLEIMTTKVLSTTTEGLGLSSEDII
jgi:hypothetical protein